MSKPTCHPDCVLGPKVDHPGYLGYRCIDAETHALPFPGEADHCGEACPFLACSGCAFQSKPEGEK